MLEVPLGDRFLERSREGLPRGARVERLTFSESLKAGVVRMLDARNLGRERWRGTSSSCNRFEPDV